MRTTNDTISELSKFVTYIESLQRMGLRAWKVPMQPGKWSVCEVISHIWLWDRYTMEMMLPLMIEGNTLGFPDHTVMNRNAENYSRAVGDENRIIRNFMETRSRLIESCTEQLREEPISFYVGKKSYTLPDYVYAFIIDHDRHHQKQIEDFVLGASNA